MRPLRGIPAVSPGDDLAELLTAALSTQEPALREGDVVVVAQKIVSKAEGALIQLAGITPGDEAIQLAEIVEKDPRLVQVILDNSRRVVRSVPGILITETIHGLICANAGVDASNSPAAGTVIPLPKDPDRSARELRSGIARRTGITPGVIITDSFNRPWRQGSINVAIGTAGFAPLHDQRGSTDDMGRTMISTLVSVADEIASAAQLVMGETGGVPAALVSGLELQPSEEGSGSLLRPAERDLFR